MQMLPYYFLTLIVWYALLLIPILVNHFIVVYLGGRSQELSVGVGPNIYSTQIGLTRYSFKLIPFGSFVKIANLDEENEPLGIEESKEIEAANRRVELGYVPFEDLPLPGRLLVIASQHLTTFVLGVVMLVAVSFLPGSGITVSDNPDLRDKMSPVPALVVSADALTLSDITSLFSHQFLEWLKRLLFFGSLQGYGGLISYLNYMANTASQSFIHFVTLSGLLSLTLSFTNLLPIPSLAGHMLIVAISNQNKFLFNGYVLFAGMTYVLMIWFRIFYCDFTFLKSLTGP
jgi:membrane-associated protease RseP (regulator of RpoE activity)